MTRLRHLVFAVIGLGCLLLGLALGSGVVVGQEGEARAGVTAATVGAGITYQGRLVLNGSPVNDTCDFRFNLWDAASLGNKIGGLDQITNVDVVSGRFTVTLNDANEFGDDAFNGAARWLRIRVRCPAGSGGYTALSPRQLLTPAPYAASVRPGAIISGTVPAATGALNVSSDWYGLRVDDAGRDGVRVNRAERNGLEVVRALNDGLRIDFTGSVGSGNVSSENNGVEIAGAEGKGVYVGEAGTDGIVVNSAGGPSTTNSSSYRDGLEIRGAAGFGAYVGRADLDGFYVQDVQFDGFQVQNAGDNGVEVNGATDLAGYFNGDVDVNGTCTGCLIATFGANVGQTTLDPGDIVTVSGTRLDKALADSTSMLMEVDQAQSGDAVVGVVAGRAELDVEDAGDDEPDGGAAPHLVPRDGPATPGAYVTIVTHGPMQVKMSDTQQTITAGTRLAAGEKGRARTLRTVTVDDVQLAENAPTVGIALESLDTTSSDGAVWVLVNP